MKDRCTRPTLCSYRVKGTPVKDHLLKRQHKRSYYRLLSSRIHIGPTPGQEQKRSEYIRAKHDRSSLCTTCIRVESWLRWVPTPRSTPAAQGMVTDRSDMVAAVPYIRGSFVVWRRYRPVKSRFRAQKKIYPTIISEFLKNRML